MTEASREITAEWAPPPGVRSSPTASPGPADASPLTPSLDPRLALERQEVHAAAVRLRLAILVGFPLWCAFAFADWIAASNMRYGARLEVLLALRALGATLIGLAYIGVRKPANLTRTLVRRLDQFVYTSIAVVIALLAIELGGLESPAAVGIPLILLAHTLTIAEHWKRNVVIFGLPAIAYPLTFLGAALVSPRIAAQLHDRHAVAVFIHYMLATGASYVFMLVAGHVLYSMRKELTRLQSIGRYQLKHRIGKGAMGEVWRAYDMTLKRDVAVKLLRRDSDDGTAVQRFEREVRAMTELKHPNTVRIYDVGATGEGLFFYAMELLEGQDLARLTLTEGPLESVRAARIVRQAARALAEAHARGIVHRDVKPANIFVVPSLAGERDFVKVLDFGVAKIFDTTAEARPLTEEGFMAGTPAYLAPEVITGGEATGRADIYALGAVLYYLLTRRPPFEGGVAQVLLDHVNRIPDPLSERRSGPLPVELEGIALRCLSKRPDERYATADHLADALGAFIAKNES